MVKKELIARVAEATGNTRIHTSEMVDAVFAAITDALANGDRVSLYGFGRFETALVPEREGRSPSTGETIRIPAHHRIKFRAAFRLREAGFARKPRQEEIHGGHPAHKNRAS